MFLSILMIMATTKELLILSFRKFECRIGPLMQYLAEWTGDKSKSTRKLCLQRETRSGPEFPDRLLHLLWIRWIIINQHQQMTGLPNPSLTVQISNWISSILDFVLSFSRHWDLQCRFSLTDAIIVKMNGNKHLYVNLCMTN